MGFRQIRIQCQCVFKISDALRHALGAKLERTQRHVSTGVLRGQGQRLNQARFGRSKENVRLIGEKWSQLLPRRHPHTHQRLDIVGIKL